MDTRLAANPLLPDITTTLDRLTASRAGLAPISDVLLVEAGWTPHDSSRAAEVADLWHLTLGADSTCGLLRTGSGSWLLSDPVPSIAAAYWLMHEPELWWAELVAP
ncbi:hypothetical protein [Sanguibacter inulinus]|jgi:hypothetical protein|uniref:Uncharacterized protein n=1 Tax=Sanguibacter inulinus TaxID=60922 RepID=A0A853EQB0_9MICO|nr:hypothetical protein [Sanguibacter inulinus]MBF0721382.1 hypothetical protein [Sanguibacter inulinus]NYS92527.1 hypothetical protein [Sanguibacter inulinus]